MYIMYIKAEAVKNEPSNVFHALSADPKFFNSSYFGLDQKKSGGRKHHSRQSRNPVLLRQLPSTSYGIHVIHLLLLVNYFGCVYTRVRSRGKWEKINEIITNKIFLANNLRKNNI